MFAFLLLYPFRNNPFIQMLLVSGSFINSNFIAQHFSEGYLFILGRSASLGKTYLLVSVLPFWNTQCKYPISSTW